MTQQSLLPHDAESEQQVLGALLLTPEYAAPLSATVTPEAFYIETYRAIAAALFRLRDAADMVSIAREIETDGNAALFQERLLPELLQELRDACIYSSLKSAEYHGHRVADLAVRRAYIAAGRDISTAAFQGHVTAAEIPGHATAILSKAAAQRKEQVPDFQSLLADFDAQDEQRRNNGGALPGIPTGIPGLDAYTEGWKPGQLCIIAAQSGFGKSTLLLQSVAACAKAGKPALFISLEMSAPEIIGKLVSATAGKNYRTLTLEQKGNALNALGKLPLTIATQAETQGGTAEGIAALAFREKERRGTLGVIAVDYLTRMNIPTIPGRTYAGAVGAVTWALKDLAVRSGATVLCAAQLNRAGTAQQGPTPTPPELFHLKESSSIEQDADCVLMIHHPQDAARKDGRVLFIRKNRNGPVGAVGLLGQLDASRFGSLNLRDA